MRLGGGKGFRFYVLQGRGGVWFRCSSDVDTNNWLQVRAWLGEKGVEGLRPVAWMRFTACEDNRIHALLKEL